MKQTSRSELSAARLRLENQYAYIEQLEELSASESSTVAVEMVRTSIRKAAIRDFENPYRFIDRDSKVDLDFVATNGAATSAMRWSDSEIDEHALELQKRLWKLAKNTRNNVLDPIDPIEVLNPATAFSLLGFDFDLEDSLGQMMAGSSRVEVAGLIDTEAKTVRVGRQFSLAVTRFTTAHELGHAVLHPGLGTLHRDRPMDGSSLVYDPIEVEANKFSASFLMPANLLRTRFAAMFKAERFPLDHEYAQALGFNSVTDLLETSPTRSALALLLAKAARFNGKQFIPLHEQFRVSAKALAIRLTQLDLVPKT